ncbi:TetR/AcrR family transcriptional regulator [Nocardia cyriacigeorgica]|jgi:AcrR family transcriptional regulator|uniref:TetR/AcrR family transcriptional regulator n=1 Tax=Nocardia cyriacigeorgica TaxID=135487 RepID=UPI0015E402E3|nr:TetR/AcrR family transcriptional regulator [Nocardia cyriacigeorgica]MBF6321281.1 TetR/AcrR family transcriptional regulator [Nocardia cyriacigeorgica]MBF6495023.1 TetR/AcrR family transcriptional regulator [Nocardia cyriacigeorgica]
MSPRRSIAAARHTQKRIVHAAVHNASVVGLDGLTIGSLAETLGMSKAGVVGPFGSREELQLAALEEAGRIFRAAVLEPSAGLQPGARRLALLIDAWIGYLAECPFPGGCFVTSASTELDGRPGRLRDRLREVITNWRTYLAAEIAAAQEETAGPHRPPDELASVLIGISMSINQEIQLLDDPAAPARGRAAMRAVAGVGAE